MHHENRFFQFALQQDDFSLSEQHELLQSNCSQSGAIVTFSGLVRDIAKSTEQAVDCIELTVYESMALKQIQEIGNITFERFQIDGLNIIHRYGKLTPTENIVFVGTASKHRSEAFAAAQMTMDYLKSAVTFWKKEHYQNGADSQWIEPSQGDQRELAKWIQTKS